jgi:hypothetical protein
MVLVRSIPGREQRSSKMTITIEGGHETRSGKSRKRAATKTKKSAPKPGKTKKADEPACDLCGAKGAKLSYQQGNAVCPSCVAAAQAPVATVPTLATAITGYVESLVKAGASATTVRSYAAELKIAATELGADMPLAEITAEKIEAFNTSKRVTHTRDGGEKSPLSVAKSRRCLRQCLAWAVESKLLATSPISA